MNVSLSVIFEEIRIRLGNVHTAQPKPVRTLSLGLGGASTAVLGSIADETLTVRSLFNRSVMSPVASQLSLWTPGAWPSLYAGVNSGRHGVYGFLTFDGYDHDIVDATNVRAHTLWELLDRRSHNSVIANVPVTAPARAIEGQ